MDVQYVETRELAVEMEPTEAEVSLAQSKLASLTKAKENILEQLRPLQAESRRLQKEIKAVTDVAAGCPTKRIVEAHLMLADGRLIAVRLDTGAIVLDRAATSQEQLSLGDGPPEAVAAVRTYLEGLLSDPLGGVFVEEEDVPWSAV